MYYAVKEKVCVMYKNMAKGDGTMWSKIYIYIEKMTMHVDIKSVEMKEKRSCKRQPKKNEAASSPVRRPPFSEITEKGEGIRRTRRC